MQRALHISACMRYLWLCNQLGIWYLQVAEIKSSKRGSLISTFQLKWLRTPLFTFKDSSLPTKFWFAVFSISALDLVISSRCSEQSILDIGSQQNIHLFRKMILRLTPKIMSFGNGPVLTIPEAQELFKRYPGYCVLSLQLSQQYYFSSSKMNLNLPELEASPQDMPQTLVISHIFPKFDLTHFRSS